MTVDEHGEDHIEPPADDWGQEDRFAGLDQDQQRRAIAVGIGRKSALGPFRSATARSIIAIAYYIENGIIAEELLINVIETIGNTKSEKYAHPEGKRS